MLHLFMFARSTSLPVFLVTSLCFLCTRSNISQPCPPPPSPPPAPKKTTQPPFVQKTIKHGELPIWLHTNCMLYTPECFIEYPPGFESPDGASSTLPSSPTKSSDTPPRSWSGSRASAGIFLRVCKLFSVLGLIISLVLKQSYRAFACVYFAT